MKYLIPGMESKERIELLTSLTKIRSQSILRAVQLHFVSGLSVVRASARTGVDHSNLHRALREINQVAAIIEKIKEIDFSNNIVG